MPNNSQLFVSLSIYYNIKFGQIIIDSLFAHYSEYLGHYRLSWCTCVFMRCVLFMNQGIIYFARLDNLSFSFSLSENCNIAVNKTRSHNVVCCIWVDCVVVVNSIYKYTQNYPQRHERVVCFVSCAGRLCGEYYVPRFDVFYAVL